MGQCGGSKASNPDWPGAGWQTGVFPVLMSPASRPLVWVFLSLSEGISLANVLGNKIKGCRLNFIQDVFNLGNLINFLFDSLGLINNSPNVTLGISCVVLNPCISQIKFRLE